MDVTERIVSTLLAEFSDLGHVEHLTRATLRLILAIFLGGLLGYEREVKGKAAGVRTHMLVCLGASVFVMLLELDGADHDAMSRVIQGVVAGIGFLCAGTILKGENIADVKGLTTAAGLWATAAIGVAVAAFCKVVVASAVFLSCYFHCRLLPLWVECDGADRLPISRCT